MIVEAALICLSMNIFHESRGEPVFGKYAVAQVTMRRARWNQKRVCTEVYRPHQFEWTRKGKLHPSKIDSNQWKVSLAIARTVLSGRMPKDFSRGATHFHAVTIKPQWAYRLDRKVRIGNHIFYG